jgi:DNA mismatch repair protein MutL
MSDGWLEADQDAERGFADGPVWARWPDRAPSRASSKALSRIRLLAPAVARRIAAGEVVERPASVVKELVENSLDAGARQVRIDVQGGGLHMIRVGDDGCGIAPDDLWLACQPHATSKLPGGDLDRISTLGFRGEALPSIAAVAELTIVSAFDGQGVGRRLMLSEGRIAADEPAARPRGTTVTVRRLFENFPARLAATERVQTESAQIGQVVRHLALAAPWVRFALVIQDRLAFQTSGSGDLATTLVDVYGPALAGRLLPIGPAVAAHAHIRGVVAGPEVTRAGKGQINLIVNGRWVQPRGLLALLETAYRPLLPRGRHPLLALAIETAPELVDVNIHPAKLDVRLRHERVIGAAAGELIREMLGRQPVPLTKAPAMGIDALPMRHGMAEASPTYGEEAAIVTPALPPLRLIGQVRERLIMLEGPEGIYLVDQHRAHERILWERLAAVHARAGDEQFVLAEPLLIELRPAQVARFGRRLDDLAAMGFDVEVFGGRTFLLRTTPVLPGVTRGSTETALGDLGEPDELVPALLALADDEAAEGAEWRERLLVSLACRTAVRRGRVLDRPAMHALVEELGQTGAPAVCPHGSPLLMHVPGSLLEKQFGWR